MRGTMVGTKYTKIFKREREEGGREGEEGKRAKGRGKELCL